MILGIMQPYFFPYLGYFDLINRSDRWGVFDIVKFAPKSWMARNRILHPTEGWSYIKLPVKKAPLGTIISEIEVKNMDDAFKRIMGQIQHYKKSAPYFRQVEDLIGEAFARAPSANLVDVNVQSLIVSCEYIGLDFDYFICSRTNLELPEISHAGQWALEISAALGAKTYINPPGGENIFEPNEFRARGVELEIMPPIDFEYECGPYEFEPNLSIIDVLMWNSPEVVKSYLDDRAKNTS